MIHSIRRSSRKSSYRKDYAPAPEFVSDLKNGKETIMSDKNGHASEEDDEPKPGKGSGKSRRELPAGAVATLKAWLLSPEHFTHPYPTPQDQVMLMQKTGIDKKQLKNWFTNARRRIWKPMLKKQLEQGKLAATGAGGGGVAVPGVVPGLMVPPIAGAPPSHPGAEIAAAPDNPHSVQAIHSHYQQAVHQHGQHQQPAQHTQQTQQHDQYGNPVYVQQAQPSQAPGAPAPGAPAPAPTQTYTSQYYVPQPQYTQPPAAAPATAAPATAPSSIPPLSSGTSPAPPPATMNKTDSHAVLMELFARDQDLVRQASESAKMKASKPGDVSAGPAAAATKSGSQSRLVNVPTLNSWPHFSSISSLNNLGTMTGVKSITSMSGADLASQGNLNKMGNLAQVKSMESMGKNDSYAFLEVFFGDRSMNSGGKEQRGVKREREEDGDVGLSLDADESPSTAVKPLDTSSAPAPPATAPTPSPSIAPSKEKEAVSHTGTLKRAYDDALAARGLISVSRSCEKLTDLALPAKMQKTLSQEYLRQHHAPVAPKPQPQPAPSPAPQQQVTHYNFSAPAPPSEQSAPAPSSQQYPGQHPGQVPQAASAPSPAQGPATTNYQQSASQAPGPSAALADPSSRSASAEVQVPSASTCARCHQTGVDTQLRPCGHMFHESCLKPSLQVPAGQPKCPIDNIPIQSALLAVPTDESPTTQPTQSQQQPQQQQPWACPAPSYQGSTQATSSAS